MDEFVPEKYSFSNEYFSISLINFPLIQTKLAEKQPTPKEFDEYMEYAIKVLLIEKPYVMLFDFGKSKYIKSEYRIKVGQWMKESQQHLAEYCKGVAYVTDSTLHKFVLQAVFFIQPPAYPYTIVTDQEKGLKWLAEKMDIVQVI